MNSFASNFTYDSFLMAQNTSRTSASVKKYLLNGQFNYIKKAHPLIYICLIQDENSHDSYQCRLNVHMMVCAPFNFLVHLGNLKDSKTFYNKFYATHKILPILGTHLEIIFGPTGFTQFICF